MFSLVAWNIRGLNRLPKQKEVQEVVRENKLSICAILESHVNIAKLQKVCACVFNTWDWKSNNQFFQRGTRIILGWDPGNVDVMILDQSHQVLHCQVSIISELKDFFLFYS